MSNDFNNILPTGANDDAAKQAGLHALNDDLFADDDDTAFEAEAEEGLSQLAPTQVSSIVDKLNADLHKKLRKKKKEKRGIPSQQGVYITIITVLLLIIIGYVVIKKVLG
jgi:hypothetical protein